MSRDYIIDQGIQAFYKVITCLSRRSVQAKYIKIGDLFKTLAKWTVVHCDWNLPACNNKTTKLLINTPYTTYS